MLRYAARLTTAGTVTWLPDATAAYTSSLDPGSTGSVMDAAVFDSTTVAVEQAGMTADGSPTASVYLALLAAYSNGVDLDPAGSAVGGGEWTVTGHPYFTVAQQHAGSTWVQAVVTLGATPPTITDGNGFIWTQIAQQQFGGGYLTVWTAPITRETAFNVADELVHLSEVCDSGIGFGLAGQAP